MRGRSQLPRRFRRSPVGKSSIARYRVLRSEPLEPRMLLSGTSLREMLTGYAPPAVVGMVLGTTATSAGPTVAQAICVNNNLAITGETASFWVLGSETAATRNFLYTWSVTSEPSGGRAFFNVNGTNAAKNDY